MSVFELQLTKFESDEIPKKMVVTFQNKNSEHKIARRIDIMSNCKETR